MWFVSGCKGCFVVMSYCFFVFWGIDLIGLLGEKIVFSSRHLKGKS